MPIVLDANLVVVLAAKDPRAELVERHIQSWMDAGESLHAPALLPYEVASAFVRLNLGGHLPVEEMETAWRLFRRLQIQLHPMDSGLDIMLIALRQRRASAYDAAYIALAQKLRAELWTLDGPLARNAESLGFPVRLLG